MNSTPEHKQIYGQSWDALVPAHIRHSCAIHRGDWPAHRHAADCLLLLLQAQERGYVAPAYQGQCWQCRGLGGGEKAWRGQEEGVSGQGECMRRAGRAGRWVGLGSGSYARSKFTMYLGSTDLNRPWADADPPSDLSRPIRASTA